MAFEVPTDLIHQAQIGFRKDAALSSFDPKDPTLPSIPTVDTSIAALDPSPLYLRCNHCKGKLLRGLQSLMCIYCGQYQKKDPPPDPLSFNSTTGYRWLLQSLNLDGSGRVGPLTEGSGRNGGQSPAEDEITLSELLDLQISWRDEPEKPDTGSDNKTFEHGSSSLNLSTVDLDNFFTGSQGDIIPDASEEQPVSSINDQSKAFGDQENLSLFQNVLPSETAVTSSVGVSGDASSGWNAEFQSADSKMQNEDSKSVDPFVGTQADLSAHMDSVFGNMEDTNNRKLKDDSDPLPSTGNDWIKDDLFANTSSATFQLAEQFNSVQAKDGLSDHPNDASSEGASGDWFKDTDWQKSSANNTAVSKQVAQLDLITKPNDNPSLGNLNASSSEGVTDWFESTNWQKSNSSNMATNKDDNTFDVSPMVGVASSPALVNDLIQSDLVNNVSSSMSQQPDKSDFYNSNKHSSDAADWFQDSQWQINASSATNVVANKDDSFDEWNDFTSSTGNQDSLQDPWKQSSNENAAASEKMSELSLFPSTTNQQEVDFGNFSQLDLFSGSSSKYNPNDSQAVNNILSEVTTASRGAAVEVGTNTERPKNDEFTPNSATRPKNDVEVLLSQMHDLSFMLKSELSIPSKPDDLGSSLHK